MLKKVLNLDQMLLLPINIDYPKAEKKRMKENIPTQSSSVLYLVILQKGILQRELEGK